jgi:F-box/leucine-rich repeat protein 10/11
VKIKKSVLQLFQLIFILFQVVAPSIVRQIDWVDKAWPRYLKMPSNMRYPKVQKYCLMSFEGGWIDFHIDQGGAAMW